MIVKKFILRDVRCFEGAQEFNIRPLTFLVGENSTGKSTILGCMQALGNFAGFTSREDPHFDFNTAPYQMGAHADIARNIGGCDGRSFDLGFEIQINAEETMRLLATLTERASGSEPIIQKLTVEFNCGLVVFEMTGQGKKTQAELRIPNVDGPSKSIRGDGKPVYTFTAGDEDELLFSLRHFLFGSSRQQASEHSKELKELLENILSRVTESVRFLSFHSLFPPNMPLHFESFAPIRSKPKRTYDPVREVEDPEGSGMPMTLMNMYQSDKQEWEYMQKELVKFGKASGLFTDIDVKKHGRSVNDPFQLQVKAIGPKTNIIDVGYGVSQILPILARVFKASPPGTSFLVQQPEVHLHPKAQAELVTLMNAIKKKKTFIVETHSDAMINRARIEILKEKLKPEDVSLIYLEPDGNKVKVHNIAFDDQANMLGVPESYRDFFLKEHDKLLGFRD